MATPLQYSTANIVLWERNSIPDGCTNASAACIVWMMLVSHMETSGSILYWAFAADQAECLVPKDKYKANYPTPALF